LRLLAVQLSRQRGRDLGVGCAEVIGKKSGVGSSVDLGQETPIRLETAALAGASRRTGQCTISRVEMSAGYQTSRSAPPLRLSHAA